MRQQQPRANLPGPGDYAPDDDDDRVATRADELFDEYIRDQDKIAEADECVAGTFDGEHYSETERVLADLDAIEPADLCSSDVLARLYQLARAHGVARRQQLREMAAEQATRESMDWPTWRGTHEMTRFHASRMYGGEE